MAPTDSIRSFIAVPLTPGLQDAVEEWQRDFRATEADVRWVPVANVHFTLKFLGSVAVADLPQIRRVCAARARQTAPFEVHLQGTGVFPHPRRPRVVWIGATTGAANLKALARELEKDLGAVGFEREKKPYRVHLTLGRCRSPRGVRALLSALEARQEAFLGKMTIDRFHLMQSDLTPNGARYTVLERFPFGLESAGEGTP